ncbi:isoprenylcysteine carboxylmethyltransferase family protein [Vitiosangium sp. GDMCC 1.1324]|uniref:methyltransferase family protein n=1 Tax=Vitiosangium sp. (strain GDMCC 1.1324) TaxID=2138576 RepID=UPI00130D8DD2|nr:isoprenylcysteine carboxylmethyltransferase family protein [Vitiosangium sp. GDMCC 1.1324]
MSQNPAMPPELAAEKKRALPQSLLVTLSLLVMGALIFLSAGRLDWRGGWIFAGLVVFSLAVNGFATRVLNPALREERWKEREDTKPFDRIITNTYLAMLLTMTVVGGLDNGRFGWTSMPAWCEPAGVILHVLGQLPMLWAFISNPHLETTVRVQKDREHKVISTGPYRFVRHPMYLGLLMMLVAWPLVFGSLWAYVPASIAMAAFILRTALEDRTLQRELPGYEEYTRRTRYRLVPGLW